MVFFNKLNQLDNIFFFDSYYIITTKYRILIEKQKKFLKNNKLWCFKKTRQNSVIRNFMKQIQRNYFGLNYGFLQKFNLEGIGFKCGRIRNKNYIWLNIGYSHRIMFLIPKGIYIQYKKRTLTCLSYNYYLLQNFTYSFKALRLPDNYKGKGIREIGKILQLRRGKQR